MSIEQLLNKLDDMSSFLSVASITLAIQASQLERTNIEQKVEKADKIYIISVFLLTASSIVDLSQANIAYENLLNSEDKVSKRELQAAKDLITSRIFSVLGSIYLIKSVLTSEEFTTETGITP